MTDAPIAPVFAQCQTWDDSLRYSFDARKLAINVRKQLVWFEEAHRFEWEYALIESDRRKHYRETRFQALSYIGRRLYCMVYCLRENSVRLISLRKANPREIKHYATTKARNPDSNA